MSNWTAITPANLNNAKVATLVDALRTAALGEGQTDRAPEIIQGVVDRIRDEIAGCKTNVLDADSTKIPKGLKSLAVRFVLWELKSALQLDLTEGEKIDHSADLNFLKRIAACEVPVALPDSPEASASTQPAAVRPQVTPPARQFTHCSQDGI